jgi:hypothetical protein
LNQYKRLIASANEKEALHDRDLFIELQLLEHQNAKVEYQLKELATDFESRK